MSSLLGLALQKNFMLVSIIDNHTYSFTLPVYSAEITSDDDGKIVVDSSNISSFKIPNVAIFKVCILWRGFL